MADKHTDQSFESLESQLLWYFSSTQSWKHLDIRTYCNHLLDHSNPQSIIITQPNQEMLKSSSSSLAKWSLGRVWVSEVQVGFLVAKSKPSTKQHGHHYRNHVNHDDPPPGVAPRWVGQHDLPTWTIAHLKNPPGAAFASGFSDRAEDGLQAQQNSSSTQSSIMMMQHCYHQ